MGNFGSCPQAMTISFSEPLRVDSPRIQSGDFSDLYRAPFKEYGVELLLVTRSLVAEAIL